MSEKLTGSILKILIEGFLIKKIIVEGYIILPNYTSNFFNILCLNEKLSKLKKIKFIIATILMPSLVSSMAVLADGFAP